MSMLYYFHSLNRRVFFQGQRATIALRICLPFLSVKGTTEKKKQDSAFRTFCQGKFTLQRSHQDYKTTVYSPEEQYRRYNSPGRDTAIW